MSDAAAREAARKALAVATRQLVELDKGDDLAWSALLTNAALDAYLAVLGDRPAPPTEIDWERIDALGREADRHLERAREILVQLKSSLVPDTRRGE